jgi:hypothetical protein
VHLPPRSPRRNAFVRILHTLLDRPLPDDDQNRDSPVPVNKFHGAIVEEE